MARRCWEVTSQQYHTGIQPYLMMALADSCISIFSTVQDKTIFCLYIMWNYIFAQNKGLLNPCHKTLIFFCKPLSCCPCHFLKQRFCRFLCCDLSAFGFPWNRGSGVHVFFLSIFFFKNIYRNAITLFLEDTSSNYHHCVMVQFRCLIPSSQQTTAKPQVQIMCGWVRQDTLNMLVQWKKCIMLIMFFLKHNHA